MDAAHLPLLIVEDNPVYAEILQRLLPKLGSDLTFVITWVDSAERALDELHRQHYELVLLDYKLPGADGLTVLAYIRTLAIATQPAVIMLTGMGREELAVQAMKSGAKDYLPKDSIDVPSLLRAITSALARKRTEEALEQERTLLNALMDNIPDFIYFKDTAFRFTRVNRALARRLGVGHPGEANGKTDADYLAPAFAQETALHEQRIIETDQPSVGKEEHIALPVGDSMWVSATKVPIHDQFGKVIGLAGVSRDITAVKRAEEQVARYAEELRVRNSQMQADLTMAREVQEAFLPHQMPVFPPHVDRQDSALQFISHYDSTVEVGGDFFDVLPLSDSCAGLFICDVMGHGVRAALITAMIRALVDELRPVGADPGRFLTGINNRLVSILKQTRMPMFASAFYLVVDVERGEARYSSAGHPHALQVHRSPAGVELLDFPGSKPGPALGVFGDAEFPHVTRPVAEGDVLMLYTDGLFEVESPQDELYGDDRLFAAVRSLMKLPAGEMVQGVLSDVKAFAAGRKFMDDVCVLAVEVKRIGSEKQR